MITKERLQELIEQGETIYFAGEEIQQIKLLKSAEVRQYNEVVALFTTLSSYHADYLFETKAEAEWYKEFGNITRTERLELSTWEEFTEQKFIWFVDKTQNQCCLYYLNVVNKIFINISGEVIEIGDLTKENYTLACRKCKELFLGEKEA